MDIFGFETKLKRETAVSVFLLTSHCHYKGFMDYVGKRILIKLMKNSCITKNNYLY